MCLGVPGRIVEIKNKYLALVDFGGIVRDVDISLVDVKPGDYVIVHAGIAISKIEPEEAVEIMKLWRELIKELGE